MDPFAYFSLSFTSAFIIVTCYRFLSLNGTQKNEYNQIGLAQIKRLIRGIVLMVDGQSATIFFF